MTRILPPSIKVPQFVTDQGLYIDEPGTPTACRDPVGREQKIGTSYNVGNVLKNAIEQFVENSDELLCDDLPFDELPRSFDAAFFIDASTDFVDSNELPCDFDSSSGLPRASSEMNIDLENIELLANVDEAEQKVLFAMEKKGKESLATIERLETKIAEQEKMIAECEGVRKEILSAFMRDEEERNARYLAFVEGANTKRLKTKPPKKPVFFLVHATIV
jgi:hypothetical protein